MGSFADTKWFPTIFANPLQRFKTKWNKKTPHEIWSFCYGISRFIGRTCLQLHCIYEDVPIGPIGYIPGLCCLLNVILLAYTTFYYISIGHFDKCVPSYCIVGACVSTYSAYWCSVLKTGLWPQLIDQPSIYIYRDDKQPSDYNRICYESLKYSIKEYVLSLTLVTLSLICACIGPTYAFLQDGTFVTLYELRIPFLENDPTTEFILNLAWQGIISLMAALAIGLIESGLALINNTIDVSSHLNVLSFAKLSERLESDDISIQEYQWELKQIYLNILHWDKYIDKFKLLLYWRLFFAPPSFTFSIAISIYSQRVLKYPAGYGLALVSYVQMAIICLTGQNRIDRTERLLTALNEFNWYLLPKERQMDILCIIHSLQNAKAPTMGPFEPLNFEALKILTRRIYTFYMTLSNLDI